MGRSLEVKTGKWSKEEDDLLKACVHKFGEGKWHLVRQRAGLKRCRKSCRLRWLNYLKPDIKRGDFAEDEIDLMIRLHKLLGNRWSMIAGRLPGRTSNDVKNYWNTNMREKGQCSSLIKELKGKSEEIPLKSHTPTVTVIRPRPFSFSRNSSWLRQKTIAIVSDDNNNKSNHTSSGASEKTQQVDEDSSMEWWKSLLHGNDIEKQGQELNGSSSFSSSMTEQDGTLDLFWDEELTRINDFPLLISLLDSLS